MDTCPLKAIFKLFLFILFYSLLFYYEHEVEVLLNQKTTEPSSKNS